MANEFIKARRFRGSRRADDSFVVAPFFGTVLDEPVSREKQAGFMEFGQALLLTTLAVVVLVPRIGVSNLPALKQEAQQPEQPPNLVIRSAQATAPFVLEDQGQDPTRKIYAQIDQYNNVTLRLVDATIDTLQRIEIISNPIRKRNYQEEQGPAFALQNTTSEPPKVQSTLPGQFDRLPYQQIDQYINTTIRYRKVVSRDAFDTQHFARVDGPIHDQYINLLPLNVVEVAAPFLPPDSGWDEAKKYYDQIDVQPDPLLVQIGTLGVPFVPVDYQNPTQDKPDHPDWSQRSLDLVAMPFPSADLGYYATKDEYQQIEQTNALFDETLTLGVPFVPEEFPQTKQERKDVQDFIYPNPLLPLLGTLGVPFIPEENGFTERKDEYPQVEQQPNPLAIRGVLEAPFKPYDWPLTGQAKTDKQDWQDPSEFAFAGLLEPPFKPVDYPNPTRTKTNAQDWQYNNVFQQSDVLGLPFIPEENGFYEVKKVYVQVEQETSEFPAPFGLLEAPFVPEENGYTYRKAEYQQVEQQPNQFAFYGNLEAPFVLEQFPEYTPKRDYEPLLETSEFPAPFEILEVPFIPEAFENPYSKKPDAQDFFSFYFDATATFVPVIPVTWPEHERLPDYQVEQQPNPLLIQLGTLEVPFIPEEFPQTGQRRRDNQYAFETSEFPAPFEILEQPFVPEENGFTSRKLEYHQVEQQPNYFAFRNLLEVPFIPEENGFTYRKNEYQQIDQQPDPLLVQLGTLGVPFAPVDFPQTGQERRDNQYAFETSEFPAPFEILAAPFIPVDFPQPDQRLWDTANQEEQFVNRLPVVTGFVQAPFIPVDFPQPDQRLWGRVAQDFISQDVGALYGYLDSPFFTQVLPEFVPFRFYAQVPVDGTSLPFYDKPYGVPVFDDYIEPKKDFEVPFETSEFPAPFGILEAPFKPITWPEFEQKPQYFEEQQPNPLLTQLGTLGVPFVPVTFPEFEPKTDYEQVFETSEFPAPFEILAAPFIPVDFPQTGQTKRDVQDFAPAYFDPTAEGTPFIPVTFPEIGYVRRDAQDFVAAYFEPTPTEAVPFIPVDFPQPDRTRWDREAPGFVYVNQFIEEDNTDYRVPWHQPKMLKVTDHIGQWDTPVNRLPVVTDFVQAPFIPVDFPQPDQRLWDTANQEEQFVNRLPVVTGFVQSPSVPYDWPQPDRTRWDRTAQDFVSTNLYPLYRLLDSPFFTQEVPDYLEPKRDFEPDFETNEFPAPFGIFGIPFIPVDFPQPVPRLENEFIFWVNPFPRDRILNESLTENAVATDAITVSLSMFVALTEQGITNDSLATQMEMGANASFTVNLTDSYFTQLVMNADLEFGVIAVDDINVPPPGDRSLVENVNLGFFITAHVIRSNEVGVDGELWHEVGDGAECWSQPQEISEIRQDIIRSEREGTLWFEEDPSGFCWKDKE